MCLNILCGEKCYGPSGAGDTGKVTDVDKLIDVSKMMDAGEGECGQINAVNAETSVFLAKEKLQVVQCGQEAPGISNWQTDASELIINQRNV